MFLRDDYSVGSPYTYKELFSTMNLIPQYSVTASLPEVALNPGRSPFDE